MEQTNSSSALRPWRLLLLPVFVALALAVYWPAFSGPFALDDLDNIVSNDEVHLKRLSVSGLAAAAFSGPPIPRPVSKVSFGISHVIHGLTAGGFRMDNAVLHALAAFVLFLLFSAVLEASGRGEGPSRNLAAAAALLWLLHPVQTQTVSYVVQRMALLSALFSFVCLWAYVRGRMARGGTRRGWFALCGVFWALALGSKETAAVVPLLVLLVEWFFFQDLSVQWLKKRPEAAAAAVLTVAAALFVVTSFDPLGLIRKTYELRDFTLGERLLTQARVVASYAALLAAPWPGRMSLAYGVSPSTGLLSPPTTLAALLFVVLALAAAAALAKKHRLAAFAVVWFFAALVMESSFLGLEMRFDHRLYLPSAFPVLAVTAGAAALLESRRQAAVVLVLAALVLGLFSVRRNHIWGDGEALWMDSLAKGGPADRCWSGLGYVYQERGEWEKGVAAYTRSVRARERRIAELARTPEGEPVKPKLMDWQKTHLAIGYCQLGTLYAYAGNLEKAEESLSRSVEARSGYVKGHMKLGLVLGLQGKYDKAWEHLQKALELEPDNVEVLLNLGDLYATTGRYQQAVQSYSRAVSIDPASARAQGSLGRLLAGLGRFSEARKHLAAALALDPNQAAVREALAKVDQVLAGRAPAGG
ncbi:MAG: tetratricopeptide repeat protein [Deltaproteobacteria bacterium]|nr:tetratricopeptide repeat protein [Deltaproteobacteria bacterium]